MSSGGKIVLVVLVLFVIAFGVFLFLSHRNRDGEVSRPSLDDALDDVPGSIEWLSERLVPRKPLRFAETQASCKDSQRYIVLPGDSCSVGIPAPDGRRWLPEVREMVLELSQGTSASVKLVQPGSVPEPRTMEAGDADSFRVYGDSAATLHISCTSLGGQSCVLHHR